MVSATAVIFLETIAGLLVIFNLAVLALCVWVDYFANIDSRRESLPELKSLFIVGGLLLTVVYWTAEPVVRAKGLLRQCLKPVVSCMHSIGADHHRVSCRHMKQRRTASVSKYNSISRAG